MLWAKAPKGFLACSLGAKRMFIARDMRYQGIMVKHAQVVFMDPAKTYLLVIVACLGIDDKFGLVVRRTQHIGGAQFASIWHFAPQVQICCLDVFPAAFWKYLSSDRFEVLN